MRKIQMAPHVKYLTCVVCLFFPCKPNSLKENKMRSRKSSSLIPSGELVQRQTQKKGDENMLGSQKETELKGGKKSAFQVIWNRKGRETLSEDSVHQRHSLKKKSTSVKVWCAPDLRGQMKIVYVVQEGVGRRKEQAHMETYALRSYLKNKTCSGERNICVAHRQTTSSEAGLRQKRKAYTNKTGRYVLSK